MLFITDSPGARLSQNLGLITSDAHLNKNCPLPLSSVFSRLVAILMSHAS